MKLIDILALIFLLAVVAGIVSCCMHYTNNVDNLMKSYQEELGC
jgi:hypothetical protein